MTAKFLKSFMGSVLAVLCGIASGVFIAAILGESPLHLVETLWKGAFKNWKSIHQSLAYATPLIFTGLAVCIAYRAGLFNIGAEGQWYMGALLMVAVANRLSTLPAFIALPLALITTMIGGAFYALLAGWLRAYRGSHEVLVTIMSNFIALAICKYVILGALRSKDLSALESVSLSTSYLIPSMAWLRYPLNLSFIGALFLVMLVWVILAKTTFGFQIRLLGESPETARRAGVPVKRRILQVMMLSGAIAALVAAHQILGVDHKFKHEAFATQYGFWGIGVALLGRGHPIGVLLAALLFGFLQQSASTLQISTHVTRDLATIMQALIILFVISGYALEQQLLGFSKLWARFRRRNV